MIRRVLFAEKNWRPDAVTLIHTGYYLMPEELSPELAERAVREGFAEVVDEVKVEQVPAKPRKAKG